MNIDNFDLAFDFLLKNNYKIILYYNNEIPSKFNNKIFSFQKFK